MSALGQSETSRAKFCKSATQLKADVVRFTGDYPHSWGDGWGRLCQQWEGEGQLICNMNKSP
jgi:hypothetical protein